MNDLETLRDQLAQRNRHLQEIAAQLKTELLGERNDIIKRIHRGLAEHGWERATSSFVLTSEAQPSPVIAMTRISARSFGLGTRNTPVSWSPMLP